MPAVLVLVMRLVGVGVVAVYATSALVLVDSVCVVEVAQHVLGA